MGTINIYSGNGANKAGLTYNGSGDITVDTEHLANTSSSIQSQLDAKLPLAGGTLTGTLVVNTAGNSLPSVSLSHSNTNADNFMLTGGVPGTSNAGFSIRDVDASANRLVIDTTGNVGIGTDSPVSALSVNSGLPTLNSQGDSTITLEYDGGDAALDRGPGIDFRQKWYSLSDSLVKTGAIYGLKTGGSGIHGGGLAFYTKPHSGSDLQETMVLHGTNRIGIGTNDPNQKLHIYGSSGNTYTKIESNANNTRSANLYWAKKSDGSTIRGYVGVTGDANKMEVATTTNDSIHFYTNNNPTNNGIFLKADGNVGIGTSSPDRLLHVSGTGNVYGKFQSTNATGAGIQVKDSVEDFLIQADGANDGGLAIYDLGRTTYRWRINSSGVTVPDKLQPSTYEPNIKWVQVTGGFNGSGGTAATSMTWYPITNQNINNYNSDYSGGDRGVNFMIKWTSGNVNRGYHHTVSGHIPILSANAYIGYQNATYSTQASGTSMSEGLNLNICHHTGCASGHNIQCRLFGDGTNYGNIYLQIRAEATPQNGDAYISFWKV